MMFRVSLPVIFGGGLLLAGCGEKPVGDRAEIVETRMRVIDDRGEGKRSMEAPAVDQSAPAELPFQWDTPEGWTDVASTGMLRAANLRFGSAGSGECYFGVMNGDGGGLEANVNRWREQMGLEPLDAEGIGALSKAGLLGSDAVEIDLEGSFRGMGGGAGKSGYRMLGRLAVRRDMAFFVKMTGTAEEVGANRAEFAAFCDSIRFTSRPEPEEAVNPFEWAKQEGWEEVASTGPMRAANFQFGEGGVGECYFGVLTGGGGLDANVNRWRGQMGLEDLDEAAIALLKRKPLMGEEAVHVDFEGSFKKMGAADGQPGYRMLGRILSSPGFTFFVKMTGPAELVGENAEKFEAFCMSVGFRSNPGEATE
ncbi:MAG: hypothetical protein P8J87_11120 [Verrucomicrobiales bacterium]|nr:hypothetical protein [Verrucomicrobiales bacterium]